MARELLKNTIGRYGNGEGSSEWSSTISLINLHSPENGYKIRASSIKSRVSISSLNKPNYLNRLAPTLNVVNDDFYVLIDLLFMF